jgi:hypothetical protein
MNAKLEKRPSGIERDLDMLFAATGALRELASDPEKAQDGSKIYDFNVRWGMLMSGRLIRLEHYHRAGELTEEQERRYLELRCELKDAMPMIESLGVSRPTVPLEVSSQERGREKDRVRSPQKKRTRKKPAVDKGVGEPGVKKGQS